MYFSISAINQYSSFVLKSTEQKPGGDITHTFNPSFWTRRTLPPDILQRQIIVQSCCYSSWLKDTRQIRIFRDSPWYRVSEFPKRFYYTLRETWKLFTVFTAHSSNVSMSKKRGKVKKKKRRTPFFLHAFESIMNSDGR